MFSEGLMLVQQKVSTSTLYKISLNAREMPPSGCKLCGKVPATAAMLR
jgi:hypothetical protein